MKVKNHAEKQKISQKKDRQKYSGSFFGGKGRIYCCRWKNGPLRQDSANQKRDDYIS